MVTDHRAAFADFASLELGTGGPDPHLSIAAHAMRARIQGATDVDAAWLAACYVGPYEVTTGSIIAFQWPLSRVLMDPLGFSAWIRDTWPRWQIRRERRAARTPVKMAQCLISCAQWVATEFDAARTLPTYQGLWAATEPHLRYLGRYAAIKLLETLARAGLVVAQASDIRPAGAWSPRLTLSWLYPSAEELLVRGGDRPAVLEQVNILAADFLQWLELTLERPVGWFNLEVLLCNYRQALENKYPGRPQDTDLKYHRKAVAAWEDLHPVMLDVLGLRQQLFPSQVLGELQGWPGVRDELGTTHAQHGYFWSDLRYSYARTTDLSQPVPQ